MALALIEGHHARPTKLPSGYRKAAAKSKLVAYDLPHATFKGRDAAIARKIKRQDGVRRDVVIALFHLLRAKDDDLIHSLRALTRFRHGSQSLL